MKVYVVKTHDGVWVQARAEGPDGMIGDLTEVIKPGDSFLDRPYEWWAALPNGGHVVEAGKPAVKADEEAQR